MVSISYVDNVERGLPQYTSGTVRIYDSGSAMITCIVGVQQAQALGVHPSSLLKLNVH